MKTKTAIKLNKSSKIVHHLLSNHQTVTFNTISTLVLILMIWLFAKSFVAKNFAIENIIDQSLMIQIVKGRVLFHFNPDKTVWRMTAPNTICPVDNYNYIATIGL